jgi:3-mercaptopyruvate sulfurtransferase SseA
VNEHTSARAVLDLNQKGMKNVAALLGGWNGWKEAKLPTESSPKAAQAQQPAKK